MSNLYSQPGESITCLLYVGTGLKNSLNDIWFVSLINGKQLRSLFLFLFMHK